MSSLKMTFSLASLVLILGLVFRNRHRRWHRLMLTATCWECGWWQIPDEKGTSLSNRSSSTMTRMQLFQLVVTPIIHRGDLGRSCRLMMAIAGLPSSFGANVNSYVWRRWRRGSGIVGYGSAQFGECGWNGSAESLADVLFLFWWSSTRRLDWYVWTMPGWWWPLWVQTIGEDQSLPRLTSCLGQCDGKKDA